MEQEVPLDLRYNDATYAANAIADVPANIPSVSSNEAEKMETDEPAVNNVPIQTGAETDEPAGPTGQTLSVGDTFETVEEAKLKVSSFAQENFCPFVVNILQINFDVGILFKYPMIIFGGGWG